MLASGAHACWLGCRSGGLAITFWLLGVAGAIAPGIGFKCCECEKSLHRADGNYCPQCGSETLVKGYWWEPRRCTNCKIELRYHKGGRRFRVCYCSECGAHLDERGL